MVLSISYPFKLVFCGTGPAANNFERNREDVFKVMGSDVGKLKEVTVRLVGREFGWERWDVGDQMG